MYLVKHKEYSVAYEMAILKFQDLKFQMMHDIDIRIQKLRNPRVSVLYLLKSLLLS